MSDAGDPGCEPARGVVVAHGELAEGLVGAVRRIAGATSGALCAVPDTGLGRREVCARVAAELTGRRNLIFTDLPSGSCHLAALIVTRERPEVPVITGVNLPMLLDFVFHRRLGFDRLVPRLADEGRSAIAVRGQDPPGIRAAMDPGRTAALRVAPRASGNRPRPASAR